MSESEGLNVLGICGSLRKGSYNRRLLEIAKDLAPDGLTIDIYKSFADIPVYNGDDEDRDGIPAAVVQLREAISAADGVLLAMPEYNFSIPGGLKNAFDWLSRKDQPFTDKPMAIMGAAAGVLGTGRSQYHMRQSLAALGAIFMPRPEVFVAAAHTKFDADGNFTDGVGKTLIGDLVAAFQKWILQVRP
ncbi:MAG TPA: NAD(P)H-dependent oxidoreductase [Alphaproteobacteria bacterium]|nr:NAD(P)H-dependent oxidoreductase [Alphaproteobacteria bacterium]